MSAEGPLTDELRAKIHVAARTAVRQTFAELVERVEQLEAEAAQLDAGAAPIKIPAPPAPTRTGVDVHAITPDSFAAFTIAWLEGKGATFSLEANDRFSLDMNRARGFEHADAEYFSYLALWLGEPIRQQLAARRRAH